MKNSARLVQPSGSASSKLEPHAGSGKTPARSGAGGHRCQITLSLGFIPYWAREKEDRRCGKPAKYVLDDRNGRRLYVCTRHAKTRPRAVLIKAGGAEPVGDGNRERQMGETLNGKVCEPTGGEDVN